jgi:hypothetical protein
MGFIRTNHIKVSNLQKIFGFRFEAGNDPGYIKIDGFQYREGLVFNQGTYFVPVNRFLKYFLIDYENRGAKVYIIKNKGMFNPEGFKEETKILKPSFMAAGSEVKVLTGSAGVFIETGIMSKILKKRIIYDSSSGSMTLNGKTIRRGLLCNEQMFVLKDDVEKALGYGIELITYKKTELSPEEEQSAQRTAKIRENVIVYYNDQIQYGTLNPSSPIGYQFFIKIDNRFKDKIELSPDCFILTDSAGNSYSGNILQASGYIPTNPTSRETIIKNSGAYLNFYNIQPKDDADIVVEFFPDAKVEPGFFIVRFMGVELMRIKVTRTYIP